MIGGLKGNRKVKGAASDSPSLWILGVQGRMWPVPGLPLLGRALPVGRGQRGEQEL